MMLLENKVAIITGAAGGLGRFQAIEYAKEGAKVVINDVKREELSQTEQMVRDVGGEVLSIVADISIKSVIIASILYHYCGCFYQQVRKNVPVFAEPLTNFI